MISLLSRFLWILYILRAIYLGENRFFFHNMIYDEIHRILPGRNLHCRLEFNHLLLDSSYQRPTDGLTIPRTLCRQSIWGLMPTEDGI